MQSTRAHNHTHKHQLVLTLGGAGHDVTAPAGGKRRGGSTAHSTPAMARALVMLAAPRGEDEDEEHGGGVGGGIGGQGRR